MSKDFLTRFLAGQRSKGQSDSPLFDLLARVQAQDKASTSEAQPTSADVLNQNPNHLTWKQAAPPALVPNVNVAPSPLAALIEEALQKKKLRGTTPAPVPAAKPKLRFTAITKKSNDAPPPVVRLPRFTPDQVIRTLTACLDAAPCREICREIFRALYAVALDFAASQGYAASVTQSVFHLPAELLMDYVQRQHSAFYDNLLFLRKSGLIHCEAHMGDLKGRKVATGTLWAVSLQPERVLAGKAAPARIRREDWTREWRDLNADVKAGRTAYNLLKSDTNYLPEKPKAERNNKLREGARNKRPDAAAAESVDAAGQSRDGEQAKTTLNTLKDWAKHIFTSPKYDTLTVRQTPNAALDVVWQLGEAAENSPNKRAAIVDRQARQLAAAFGDTQLAFWRRLIWNLTRGLDVGTNLTDDVGAVLARILGDVKHDLSDGGTPPRNPAAVANAALTDLLAHLRMFEGQRVGVRPIAS